MLPDEDKTEEQLINEPVRLRQRVSELETSGSERSQAEEALREARDRAQNYLDVAGVIIVAINTKGEVTLINKKGCEVLGCKEQEVIGKNWFDNFLPPGIKQGVEAASQKLLVGEIKPVEYYENPILTKSGEERIIAWHNTVLRDKAGAIIGHLSSGEDITERRRAEEALRESEAKYRSLVTNVTLGVFRSTPEPGGRFLEVNPAMVKITGYSRKELLQMNVSDLYVDPKERELVLEEVASDKGKATRQLRLKKKDGAEIVVSDTKVAVRDDAGKVIYFDGILEDITERRRAEEREKRLREEINLASRLAAVGELAAGVAHEINNPLTGVLGFSQRLLRKITDQNIRRDLEIIHNEARRAAEIVQNLLTFARRREPKKQYVDINEILQKALELRGYELITSNVEVAADLAPVLPQVMADIGQIQQVFLNIILNAEQIMAEANRGGKLSIKTRQVKDYIRISFSDNGPGILAEHLDRLFDPFFTTRGAKGGTGLGLSVCHGIVTEHGGRIYARSRAGRGATFFVELPLTTEEIDESKVVEEEPAVRVETY